MNQRSVVGYIYRTEAEVLRLESYIRSALVLGTLHYSKYFARFMAYMTES